MSGLAAAQYLSYLLVGALYFLVFGAMAGVAVRASLVGLGAVFVPRGARSTAVLDPRFGEPNYEADLSHGQSLRS